MTITLTNPQPADLGFVSPALGPWFSQPSITLGEPDADLGVAVNFSTDGAWLPPSSGLFSLFIAGSERPYHIAGLRKPDGSPAFSDDRTVAVFRLLPEVEERLHSLSRFIPPVTATPPTGLPDPNEEPARARVRWFALELAPTLDPANPAAYIDALGGLIVPGYPDYAARGLIDDRDIRRAKAAYLGLEIPKTGTEVVQSSANPMADLKRPGIFPVPGGSITPEPEKILKFPGGMSTRLFVFDDRGLPLDPGAVAAWWRFLAGDVFDNLWAAGFTGADLRTAGLSGGALFSLHFINPHGGPLPNDHPLMERVQVTGVSALPGESDPRNLRTSTAGGVTVTFSPPDTTASVNNAPFPLAALLPTGRFSGAVQAWVGDWTSFAINRDFVQVALVEVETHLVGVPRLLPESTGNDVTRRRAADQNRATTRVNVARAAGQVFSSDLEAAAQSILEVFDGSASATLVTSAADRDYGFLEALSALPAGRPPDRIPEFTSPAPPEAQELRDASGRVVGLVHPLAGGERTFLVELALGSGLAGAWVRAWAQDFDPSSGSRKRLDGGGGRADGSGRVLAAIKMEEGATGTSSPSGLDLLIKTEGGAREYPDLRFNRPAAAAGGAVAFSDASSVIICETGQSLATSGLANSLPSGATLVALAGEGRPNHALIDRTSIPVQAFISATLVSRLESGDRLVLAQPAFIKQPDGGISSSFDGITVQRFTRSGVDRIMDGSAFAAGAPLPTQEWLETASAAVDSSGNGTARAAMTAGPALARFHELLPHQQGHPGAPAATEYHSTGASLNGAATLLLAETVRDRRERLTHNLLQEAFNNPFPDLAEPPAGDPAAWVAILRTVGKGSEGEAGMDMLADLLTHVPLTPGTILREVERWVRQRNIDADTSELPADVQNLVANLNSILANLPPGGPGQERNVASAARALDRRLQASRGLREGALSLLAAVKRAEDFIYIETPALDNLACGSGDEQIELLSEITARMSDTGHRALKLILCVPLKYSPFTPRPMQNVRDSVVKTAIESLRSLAHFDQRVAVFSPNAGTGRSLHLASTTVIVDDAYLFSGGTHLWRRGLSFDSSLAAVLFDETVRESRPRLIRQLRRRIIADRLGLQEDLLPDNPADLVEALRLLPGRDGARRLTRLNVLGTTATAGTTDSAVWNPDGSPGTVFNLGNFLASLVGIREHVPPAD